MLDNINNDEALSPHIVAFQPLKPGLKQVQQDLWFASLKHSTKEDDNYILKHFGKYSHLGGQAQKHLEEPDDEQPLITLENAYIAASKMIHYWGVDVPECDVSWMY